MPSDAESKKSDLLDLPSKLGDRQVALLMAEYEHLGTSFLSNEDMGERRVNIFLGLIAAVSAALGLAAEKVPLTLVFRLAAAAATVLLLFGLVTLRRLMQRNLVTTDYLNGMRRIRAFFARAQPALARVLLYVPGEKPLKREREGWRWGLGKAGYLEVVAAANCLLVVVALGGWSWAGDSGSWWWIVLAALVAWIAQLEWTGLTYRAAARRRRERRGKALRWWAEQEAFPESLRQGVGLLILNDKGQVLAFERSDVPDAWQLPQGGVGEGEPLERAAWRELEEETGLTAEHVTHEAVSDAWVGYELPVELRATKTGRGQIHRWFVFRMKPGVVLPAMPSSPDGEFRDRRWMTIRELERLTVSFRKPIVRTLASWFSTHLQPDTESS